MKKTIMYFSLLLIPVILVSNFLSPASTASKSNEDGHEFVTQSIPHLSDQKVARIYFEGRGQLDYLSGSLDIWEVDHEQGWLIAQVTPQQWQALESTGFRIELDLKKTEALSSTNNPLPGQIEGIPSYPCYRTVEEIYASLSNLQTNFPDLLKIVDIGDSWEKVQLDGGPGYDILAAVLTNKAISGDKPRFILIGSIHTREYATAETVIRFAEKLLNDYGVDPDVTWLIDNFELHIIPMANPDGRKIAETGISWRKNTDNNDGCNNSNYWGTDLNRNSSFGWGGAGSSVNPCDETYHGPSAASEPEIQAIQTYVESLFLDMRGPNSSDPAPLDTTGMLISLHSYGQLVLWPWGNSDTNAPNHTQLQTLGRKLAHYTSYYPEQASGLYTVSGSTDDWSYGELGVASYTIEMGTNFFQACESFDNEIYPQANQSLEYAFKAIQAPYRSPAGPEVLNLTISVPSLTLESNRIPRASVDDTRYSSANGIEPTQPVITATFTVDQLPWSTSPPVAYPMTPSDGNFDENIEAVQGTIDTSGLTTGRHIIYVRGQDAAGNWGVLSAIFLDVVNGEPNPQPFRIFIPFIQLP